MTQIESEVFLLGKWKNYDELEESLSLPELVETVDALRRREFRTQKFDAAIQGIDIGDPEQEATDTSFDEIWSSAMKEDPKTEEESLAMVGIGYESE